MITFELYGTAFFFKGAMSHVEVTGRKCKGHKRSRARNGQSTVCFMGVNYLSPPKKLKLTPKII